jgi:hypothetical protein
MAITPIPSNMNFNDRLGITCGRCRVDLDQPANHHRGTQVRFAEWLDPVLAAATLASALLKDVAGWALALAFAGLLEFAECDAESCFENCAAAAASLLILIRSGRFQTSQSLTVNNWLSERIAHSFRTMINHPWRAIQPADTGGSSIRPLSIL